MHLSIFGEKSDIIMSACCFSELWAGLLPRKLISVASIQPVDFWQVYTSAPWSVLRKKYIETYSCLSANNAEEREAVLLHFRTGEKNLPSLFSHTHTQSHSLPYCHFSSYPNQLTLPFYSFFFFFVFSFFFHQQLHTNPQWPGLPYKTQHRCVGPGSVWWMGWCGVGQVSLLWKTVPRTAFSLQMAGCWWKDTKIQSCGCTQIPSFIIRKKYD